MKKLSIIIFCGILFATGCTKELEQDEECCLNVIKSGTTGSLTWELCEDGTLTISGNGAMPDYQNNVPIPWYEFRNDIIKVIIGNSVSKIGVWAFLDCENLRTVTISKSVTTIGAGAFLHCSSLTSVTIGSSVSSIDELAFGDCISLTEIINYTVVGKSLRFCNCVTY